MAPSAVPSKRARLDKQKEDVKTEPEPEPTTPTSGDEGLPKNRELRLRAKAKEVTHPTPEAATLEPKYMFTESIFAIFMCFECRRQCKLEAIIVVDEDREKLVLNLCRICRENINAHRKVQYYHHELPMIKKKYEDD